jgi:uracil-DNA glycosylase
LRVIITVKLIGHNKEIEDQIFKKYAELRKEKDLCKECNAPKEINNGRPVSFFVVGEDFPKQKFRVMFVGKTVQDRWEDQPVDPASDFIDPRKYAREHLFMPSWSTYPFFQCIKEICQILWKTNNLEDIWRRIAITNLVKCSTSPGCDTTPELLKRNCIQNARFLEEEVKIAKPTHIVFFTGLNYDEYLDKIGFGYNQYGGGEKIDHLECWEGPIKMWQKNFIEDGEVKMRYLRTYHPSFFKFKGEKVKEVFCQLIAQWITDAQ